MFIYNLKLNKNRLSKVFITIALIIIIAIIAYSVYVIFFKSSSKSGCDINLNKVFEVNEFNYANILKAANDDVDSYVGCKVRVVGYVYRLLDFNKNQFVVARDMKFGDNGNSLVIGFLCNYNKAANFSDGTWVEIEGEIIKGNFNGDIAILNVTSMKEATSPENVFVNPPDNTYIPTSNMF